MKYEKPEIVAVGSAVGAVKAQDKPEAGTVDIELGRGFTANAYQADE